MHISSSNRTPLTILSLLACSAPAFAHLSYNGRNLGIFSGLELQSNTITGQTVPNNWGWADGSDGDFGHSHQLRFFRFTLENTATITISVTSLNPSAMLPGFSIYSGLAHSTPDYETELTFEYLATLPGPAKEGAFNALGTWKMGNDVSTSFADFSTFTYMGNAADGTSANFGNALGINGDGLADGFVSKSFELPAGTYTIAIGGAVYSGQGTGPQGVDGANQIGADSVADAITVGVTVVPEPASGLLSAGGLLILGMTRRRRASSS